MNHLFRGILWVKEKTADGLYGGETDRILAQCENTLSGLLEMINKLLDISRLQTGSIIPEKRFHQIWAVTELSVQKLSHAAKTKGVEILNGTDAKQRLLLDDNLIGEALLNLLSNAIKFTPGGGVITVSSPSAMSVAVKDSGTGIPPKMLNDIFKHEVKTTTPGTDGETGTGLGMPFCKEIMDAHSGKIKVDTGEVGTTFTLEFPEVRPVVIVADDQEVHRILIKEQLEKITDAEVVAVDNGRIAIKLAKELDPITGDYRSAYARDGRVSVDTQDARRGWNIQHPHYRKLRHIVIRQPVGRHHDRLEDLRI